MIKFLRTVKTFANYGDLVYIKQFITAHCGAIKLNIRFIRLYHHSSHDEHETIVLGNSTINVEHSNKQPEFSHVSIDAIKKSLVYRTIRLRVNAKIRSRAIELPYLFLFPHKKITFVLSH